MHTHRLAPSKAALATLLLGSSMLLGACSSEPSGPAPVVVSVDPASGARGVSPAAKLTVVFDRAMDEASLSGNVVLSETAGTVTWSAETSTATFTPNAPLEAARVYTATVRGTVKSADGVALGSDYVWTFDTNDITPPAVVSTNPADGATNRPRTLGIEVVFDEPIDPSTLEAGFVLEEVGVGNSSGTTTWNAETRTAVFTPAEMLTPSASYVARLTTALKDLAGNSLASEVTIGFTIVEDKAPPKVVSTVPAANATDVDIAAPIEVIFDEPLDPTTVNETNFRITGKSGAVSWDAKRRAAVLVPDELVQNTRYTATISGVKDTTGNTLASAHSWSFTVARDVTAPTVVETQPANGANPVPISQRTFTAKFSEPVSGYTVTAARLGVNVPVTTSYDAATRTLTGTLADDPLVAGMNYAVSIENAVDGAGNTMAPFGFGFRTEPDSVPPTVVATSPVDGEQDVPVTVAPTITFSEELSNSTVNGITISLSGIATDVAWDSGTKTATITPLAPLTPETEYTIVVSVGIKDSSGNPLAAPVIVKFRTGTVE